jgi:hypothetical protein
LSAVVSAICGVAIVSELAPGSKSADEIRALWQWVEARLKARATASKQPVSELPSSPRTYTTFLEASADKAALVSWSGF